MTARHLLAISTAALALAACEPKATTTEPASSAASPEAGLSTKTDADMQAVLDAQASLNPKPIESLTPEEARKQPSPADGARIVMQQRGIDPNATLGVVTKDITYKAAAGSLPARVYIPEGADPKKPLPVVVYFHGGGFVIADIKTYDSAPRAISKAANAIVISFEYRQAPEHKFPAAHDDAFAAYQWTLANAGKYGGDPKRVAVMGESAGGALALATSVKARDTKLQLPVEQVLVYPVGGVDMNTPSYQTYAASKPLNKPMMEWFVKHFTKGPEDLQDPRIDAIGKADLKGLPDTTIVLAEIDPLRTDGERLGEKLKQAGVNVSSQTFEGVTHEFFGMGLVVGDAALAEGFVVANLREAF